MSKKDMIALKVNINTKRILKGLADGVKVELSSELTKETKDWLPKAACIGEQVLTHMGDCLKEMAEDRMLCLRFAELLGIMPEDCGKGSVEITPDNAEDLLSEMEADDSVPDEIKEFMRSMVKVTKFIDKKKEKGCNHEHH